MNARELHDKLEYEHKAGLRWLFSSDAQERETVLRALRLLDAAEGGDGTPETDALAKMCSTQFQLTEIARSFERERNGLAARVAGLEKALSVIDSPELLEVLSDIEHERWSAWMRYQDTAPQAKRDDWPRKVAMRYSEMTNNEQESDRIEVRKTLNAIRFAIDAARRTK